MTALATRRPRPGDSSRPATRPGIEPPPHDDILLQTPPAMPRAGNAPGGMGGGMQMMMYLPMMLGMGMSSFMMIGNSGGIMPILGGGLMVASLAGMGVFFLVQKGAGRKASLNDERRDYLRYLDGVRRKVHTIARQQRAALLHIHPDPVALASVAASPRAWERRRAHDDFGQLRFASGSQRLASALKAPTDTPPLEDLDPVCLSAARHFLRTYAAVPDLPVAIALRSYPRIVVSGDRTVALDVVRAMLGQLVTLHGPSDVRLATCTAADTAAHWEWVKWLPHTQHRSEIDGAGPVRLAADGLGALEHILGPDLADRGRFDSGASSSTEWPHIVVVLDGGRTADAAALAGTPGHDAPAGVTVIEIVDESVATSSAAAHVVCETDRVGMVAPGGIVTLGVPDRLDIAGAEVLARSMASHRVRRANTLSADEPVENLSRTLSLPDLLGIPDARALDLTTTWARRSPRARLRIPIGLDADGNPVEVDFKESAEEGMGPHGLLIGATGSGKSELLRTLVLGLAATHSSETLNFALVDFKGGATFAGLSRLPHTAAVITNLADDTSLVERMRDAIHGEMMRRQEELHARGNYASVRDYEKARESDPSMAPIPTLMVIIDEFSELLSAEPEMIDLFVMIGRLGRSLAVHLLLASQRLDEGRLRGLDSHLSYRIGLRTFNASESRSVLGVPDAADLPPLPGSGYLRTDSSTLIRFKSAYVSGPLPPQRQVRYEAEEDLARPMSIRSRVQPFTLAPVDPPQIDPAFTETFGAVDPTESGELDAAAPGRSTEGYTEASDPRTESVLDALVNQMNGQGPPPHRLWLPPLDLPPSLDRLLPGLTRTAERGLTSPEVPVGTLVVPVGLVDRPFEQRQEVYAVSLAGANGHLAIVGGPRSGKSTALRAFLSALALTHTPAEAQFYCLDFGGGALTGIAGLPHCGGIAGRLDPDRCSRLMAEVGAVIDEREQLFVDEGIDSIDTFRRRRAAGERLGERGFGDVFLVVDGYLTLRDDFDLLHDELLVLVSRGLAFGVHVVITANRWMDLRMQVRDLVGSKLELRLGDPTDSEMDRRAAAKVPGERPGRGITKQKLHWLSAIPRVDGSASVDDLTDGVQRLTEAVTAAWPGPPAPRVRLLPRNVAVGDLAPETGGGNAEAPLVVPVALAERDLKPVSLDFRVEPHLVILGDSECGKTAVLRLIGQQLSSRAMPSQAKFLVIDHRRSLLSEFNTEHSPWYSGTDGTTEELLEQVVGSMQERLPSSDITPAQLRRRDWWSGPELFVLIDDYDLVVTGSSNPTESLVPLLPHARDIGLHVIVAQRSGGASRIMYDPLIQRMVELGGTSTLLMSGSPDEGPIIGRTRMRQLPPGRGILLRRSTGEGLVQMAWSPSTAEDIDTDLDTRAGGAVNDDA
jgi:DNA segregation ATPase FtsK/SpoIIIE, S-DNA-T family